MKKPKVSIILPLYNSVQVVGPTLESIRRQALADFELIIVDDGSGDNAARLVEEIGDPRFKYFWKENGGAGSARNVGLKNAGGDYIAYCDHDDLLAEDHLAAATEYLAQNPAVDMVYTKCKRIYPDGTERVAEQEFDKKLLEVFCYFVPSMVVHRKKDLWWDEELSRYSHDDLDFFLRFSDRYNIAQLDVVSVTRRVLRADGGYFSSLRDKKYFIGLKMFFEKRLAALTAAPYPGYYFDFLKIQCLDPLRYAEKNGLARAEEILPKIILPMYEYAKKIDANNPEVDDVLGRLKKILSLG